MIILECVVVKFILPQPAPKFLSTMAAVSDFRLVNPRPRSDNIFTVRLIWRVYFEMKFLKNGALLFLVLAICSTSAVAQKPKSKDEAIKEIAGLLATKKPEATAKAYPLAKDFLVRFAKDNKDGKDKFIPQVKVFVEGYRENAFYASVDDGKFADAFAFGKEILGEHPDDIAVMLNLAHAGYKALGANRDKTYADDTIAFAKKAAQALESGSPAKSYAPFKDKDDATAWMYYIPGFVLIDKDTKESAIYIYKATTFNSTIKDSSLPYYLISAYYEDVYAKVSTDLKTRVAAKTISDAELKTANERVNKSIEMMMDAYARAYTKGETEKNPNAAQWKERLVQIYKFTNKTEEGLKEFVKFAILTPMPDPSKL